MGGLRDTQGTLGTARRRALASSEEVCRCQHSCSVLCTTQFLWMFRLCFDDFLKFVNGPVSLD